MAVGAGLYMCDLVKKFTFAISSPDEFFFLFVRVFLLWSTVLVRVLFYVGRV